MTVIFVRGRPLSGTLQSHPGPLCWPFGPICALIDRRVKASHQRHGAAVGSAGHEPSLAEQGIGNLGWCSFSGRAGQYIRLWRDQLLSVPRQRPCSGAVPCPGAPPLAMSEQPLRFGVPGRNYPTTRDGAFHGRTRVVSVAPCGVCHCLATPPGSGPLQPAMPTRSWGGPAKLPGRSNAATTVSDTASWNLSANNLEITLGRNRDELTANITQHGLYSHARDLVGKSSSLALILRLASHPESPLA